MGNCYKFSRKWEGLIVEGKKEMFWSDENILSLFVMSVTWVYAIAKTHQTEHLKWVHFIVYKLFLKFGKKKL